MGIPNIDLELIAIYHAMFEDLKEGSIDHELDNLFEGLSSGAKNQIKEYLADLNLNLDVNNRIEGKQLYFIPSFPMADIPFPQICCYVGEERMDNFLLGGQSGNAYNVTDSDDEIIAYDVESASLSHGSWQTDIICSHRDEVIWLSRMCQYAIMKNLLELDAKGLKEVTMSVAEVMLNKEHFPTTAYARRITIQGQLVNTWIKRIPVSYYQTGINKAIEEIPE